MTLTRKRLSELLDDHQRAHSSFQIRHFIIRRAGLTPYGMYRQALRELSTRWYGLCAEVAGCRAEKPENELEAEMYRLEFEARFLDKVREFCEFYMLADWLKGQVGELTPSRRAELEEEFWTAQMMKQAATDVLSTGRVSGKTLESLSAFPEHAKPALLEAVFDMPQVSRGQVAARLSPWLDLPEFDVTPQVLHLTRQLIDDAVDDRLRSLPPGGADALPGDDVAR